MLLRKLWRYQDLINQLVMCPCVNHPILIRYFECFWSCWLHSYVSACQSISMSLYVDRSLLWLECLDVIRLPLLSMYVLCCHWFCAIYLMHFKF